jgi:transcriptional regulator with XRE-family HTH domain
MEETPSLPETLQRLQAIIQAQGLDRSQLLNPAELATRTALPEDTVRTLLAGGSSPSDTVNDRARARISTLAKAYLQRSGRRMSDLAADISRELGISENWARQICEGRKVPNLEITHGLAKYFCVDGGVTFFTAPADEALSHALQPILHTLEKPESDPVQALMNRYGVKGADLRVHGSMTRRQLERLLEGVFKSVLPEEEDTGR